MSDAHEIVYGWNAMVPIAKWNGRSDRTDPLFWYKVAKKAAMERK